MKQSRVESVIETCANIGTGFFLSVAVWAWIVRPMIDVELIALEQTFVITGIFTVTSVLRSYFWRRFFERGFHRLVHRYVRKWVW